eukprot:m.138054 g.138054  ORF g.138054 m.138054 type:complete len:337 (-) comp52515_c0_seq1:117-1127(-)
MMAELDLDDDWLGIELVPLAPSSSHSSSSFEQAPPPVQHAEITALHDHLDRIEDPVDAVYELPSFVVLPEDPAVLPGAPHQTNLAQQTDLSQAHTTEPWAGAPSFHEDDSADSADLSAAEPVVLREVWGLGDFRECVAKQQHRSIAAFCFNDCRTMDDQLLQFLATELRKCRNLKSLTLCGQQLTAANIGILCAALRQLHDLEHISLARNPLGDDGFAQLSAVLQRLFTLITINISKTGLTDASTSGLVDIIHQCPRLETFTADRNSFNFSEDVARALLSAPKLKSVSICRDVSDAGELWQLKDLGAALPDIPRGLLTKVALRGNEQRAARGADSA